MSRSEADLASVQVNAGFFRLAKYNAKEWYYFLLGSAGSAVLGLVSFSRSKLFPSMTGHPQKRVEPLTRDHDQAFLSNGPKG